jgi:hypothetical protein
MLAYLDVNVRDVGGVGGVGGGERVVLMKVNKRMKLNTCVTLINKYLTLLQVASL